MQSNLYDKLVQLFKHGIINICECSVARGDKLTDSSSFIKEGFEHLEAFSTFKQSNRQLHSSIFLKSEVIMSYMY